MLKQQLQQASDWQTRFRLLIQASKNLPQPDEESLSQMQKISGCEAQLYWLGEIEDGRLKAKAYSDARIMNGILFLLLSEINGMEMAELQKFQLSSFLEKYGLTQNLSQTRRVGLQEIENHLQNLSRLVVNSTD